MKIDKNYQPIMGNTDEKKEKISSERFSEIKNIGEKALDPYDLSLQITKKTLKDFTLNKNGAKLQTFHTDECTIINGCDTRGCPSVWICS